MTEQTHGPLRVGDVVQPKHTARGDDDHDFGQILGWDGPGVAVVQWWFAGEASTDGVDSLEFVARGEAVERLREAVAE